MTRRRFGRLAPPKVALPAVKPPNAAFGASRQEIYWIGAAEFRILAAMAAWKIFNAAEDGICEVDVRMPRARI